MKVAVILAGCGFLDGAEIHEAVSALIAIDRAGATYQVFAPDKPQMHVIDHLRQQPAAESRNVLVEAARIARGNARPLSELNMADYDAVVLPGGYGAAKNLVDYATQGVACAIDPQVDRVLREAHKLRKPIGAICISPVIVARALGVEHHPLMTIGVDDATASDLAALGARHEQAPANGIVVDEANRVVSTPAYMTAGRIAEVFDGVTRLVERVLAMAGRPA